MDCKTVEQLNIRMITQANSTIVTTDLCDLPSWSRYNCLSYIVNAVTHGQAMLYGETLVPDRRAFQFLNTVQMYFSVETAPVFIRGTIVRVQHSNLWVR